MMTTCPFCAENIDDGSVRCPCCEADLAAPAPAALAVDTSMADPPQPAEAPGLLGQLAGVFTHPVALFQSLSRTPRWAQALAAMALAAFAANVIWIRLVDNHAYLRRSLGHLSHAKAEFIDLVLAAQWNRMAVGTLVWALVGIPVAAFVSAFLLWVLGRMAAEDEAPSFEHALSAATATKLPGLVQTVLAGAACLARPVGASSLDQMVPTSPGFWVQGGSRSTDALLNALDPFSLYTIVLSGLAARHLLKLKSWGVGLTVFAVVGAKTITILFAR